MITTGPGGETIFPPAATPENRIPPPDVTHSLPLKTRIVICKADLDAMLFAERQAALQEAEELIACPYHDEYEKHCNSCHMTVTVRGKVKALYETL